MEIIWGQWIIGKMIDGVEHYKLGDDEFTTDKKEALNNNMFFTKGKAFVNCSDWNHEYIIDVKKK